MHVSPASSFTERLCVAYDFNRGFAPADSSERATREEIIEYIDSFSIDKPPSHPTSALTWDLQRTFGESEGRRLLLSASDGGTPNRSERGISSSNGGKTITSRALGSMNTWSTSSGIGDRSVSGRARKRNARLSRRRRKPGSSERGNVLWCLNRHSRRVAPQRRQSVAGRRCCWVVRAVWFVALSD